MYYTTNSNLPIGQWKMARARDGEESVVINNMKPMTMYTTRVLAYNSKVNDKDIIICITRVLTYNSKVNDETTTTQDSLTPCLHLMVNDNAIIMCTTRHLSHNTKLTMTIYSRTQSEFIKKFAEKKGLQN